MWHQVLLPWECCVQVVQTGNQSCLNRISLHLAWHANEHLKDESLSYLQEASATDLFDQPNDLCSMLIHLLHCACNC